LTIGDFTTPGDHLLVTDSATGLEWLAPIATRNVSLNMILGGYEGLLTTEGFRYATHEEVDSMIVDNFGSQTTASPGDAAGYAAAGDFFDVFGLNAPYTCIDPDGGPGLVACPRTQGWSMDPTGIWQVGMLQWGPYGQMLDDAAGPTADFLAAWGDHRDFQLGHWLVRDAPLSPVPEPATFALLGTGIATLIVRRRRRL
jgi:hypothetical protein